MNNLQRITVYLDREEYKKLRAKLILLGVSVSKWLRDTIKKFLKEDYE